jgi:hypothetical protein
MILPGRWRPGSFQFLAVLFLGGGIFAWIWTQLGYYDSNLERQGVDIVHHAVIVHQVYAPGGLDRQIFNKLADYPNTSHRLAALTLGWFGGDAIVALRFAALTTICWLLALQFTLVCRFLPWLPAGLVVLLWQWLCCWGKVSNPNHFWEGMYNYSRAVGGLGLWGGLVLLTAEPAVAWQRRILELLAVGAAMFALACHLVPGAVALGGLGIYALAGWLRERRPERLVLLVLTVLATVGMYYGTSVWKVMVDSAGLNGWLPVGPLPLLLTWIPLAGLAAWFLTRPIVGRAQSSETTWLPTEPLMTALLAAGGLQAVAFARMLLWENCAPYAVKSLFFYTFPLGSLLAILWLLPYCRRLPSIWQGYWQTAERRKLLHVLAGGFLLASFALLYHQDRGLRSFVRLNEDSAAARRYYPPHDQLPPAVSRALADVATGHQGWYYLDPNQPFGAFYATLLGLHLEFNTAIECRDRLLAHDYAALGSLVPVRGILVPAPTALPLPCGQSIGSFREYPLAGAAVQEGP